MSDEKDIALMNAAEECCVALRTELTATQEKLAAAEAGYARLAERLEITHMFQNIDGLKMVRVDVPRDQWEQQIDGISCRDETIKLQDAVIAALKPTAPVRDDARDERLINFAINAEVSYQRRVAIHRTAKEILAAFNTQDNSNE